MTHIRRVMATAAAMALMASLLVLGAGPASSASGQVLILGPTVTGGASSLEALAATNLGFTIDVVDNTAWAAMSTADFAAYEGIILGDPTCSGSGAFQAAIDNAATWGAAIDGNALVVGTDPVFHQASGGAALTDTGVAFALDGVGDTGLYATLSCFGGGTAGTDLLAGLGSFTVDPPQGAGNNDIAIVATHPALTGLTEADLSDWFCSVHETFSGWPTDFEVLAISEDGTGTFTAPSGATGTPYILARGEGVEPIRAVTLTPETATNTVGEIHTVTATVAPEGDPVADATVNFEVLSGPHTGETGTSTTNANGEADFSYTGTASGTDTIIATWDNGQAILESNTVEKIWVDPPVTTTTTTTTVPTAAPAVATPASPAFTG